MELVTDFLVQANLELKTMTQITILKICGKEDDYLGAW